MNIAYFDCIAGASGDMILGALLDLGLDESLLREQLAALRLDGFTLHTQRVQKNGLRAVKVDVEVHDPRRERRLPEILQILQQSSLPAEVITQATTIIHRLAEVEARIHAEQLEQVHLHELGGLDTLVDITATLLGLSALQIDQVCASPLPMGSGFVNSRHGLLPLPAPATLALLRGVPLRGVELEAELVTPTGAALLAGLVLRWGPIPPMTLSAVGYGAGGRELPIPNLLRVLMGTSPESSSWVTESLTLVETNIDDQNPQFYDHILRRLFQAGALDAWLSPIQMKKNRSGTLLGLVCRLGDLPQVEAVLFTESSTLGVRVQTVERRSLPREVRSVETPYGTVRVKFASLGSEEHKFAPEYEDCRAIAEEKGVPLREVYLAAQLAAKSSLEIP